MRYNKLHFAIFTALLAQSVHAININPVQIQSSFGELLYAEINFQQSDLNAPIEASLATNDELQSIGAQHNPPNQLNIYTRQNKNGSGVITITSSRPITESELNFVIKIKEGTKTRLQHIKKTLLPHQLNNQNTSVQSGKPLTPLLVNEQDLGLNLPSSHLSSTNIVNPQNQNMYGETLKFSPQPPPALNSTAIAQTAVAPSQPSVIQVAPQKQPENIVTQQTKNEPINRSIQQEKKPSVIEHKAQSSDSIKSEIKNQQERNPSVKPIKKVETTQHTVKRNESLWIIASRIATAENRDIKEVMSDIKENNSHAFINGDAAKLKQGTTLNLSGYSAASKSQKSKATTQKKKSAQATPAKKYRLNQAEMSLVAEKTAKNKTNDVTKNVQNGKKSDELSANIMTSRAKAVKLQKNVTQLEMALNQKDYRIQLLNARLAQLQQQLEKKQVTNKSNN